MDLLDLQDRIVLITGGCGAIGRVIGRITGGSLPMG